MKNQPRNYSVVSTGSEWKIREKPILFSAESKMSCPVTVVIAGLAALIFQGCGGDGSGKAVRNVTNVEDSFAYENTAEGYSKSESYDWSVTTSMAILALNGVDINGGSVRLVISNPGAEPPLFDQTFQGSEQVPTQQLGPASADQWRVDLEFDEASGEFGFSLEATVALDID